jgi:hypothetical protein
MREARAYNQSIYLMVGMPYLLLGAFSWWVYRGLRQKARADRAAAERPLDGKGDRPCLTASLAEASSPTP